ncbi:hypothetical protein [Paracoccus sp. IB05]|uniref:hypothetical protein n=1 Tax=Paracoccus sp. IB05 TaxID=2779367 RepID=UPI0018E8524C|nr:hypothetical protein [Paracoccus sp. IB05]MBJ2150873.1 hypothetical protein [Paracoccus sp. IB05]
MRLLLRPEDRSDRQDRKTSPRGQVFASGGIHCAMARQVPGQGGSPLADAGPKTRGEAGLPQMPATAWRVPGFTRPARLSRSDWLIRAFALLARSGHPALNIAVLCDCPGASRAGFYGFFSDLAAYRLEVIALWERTSRQPVLSLPPAETGAPRLALARLLELADEAMIPPSAATEDGDPDAPCAVMIERAIRDWARCDVMVAAALARVDGWRLAQVQDLLVRAGLSQRRAAERAAVFYAARLGFDRLRDSTDLFAAAPMRALALAILGGRDMGGGLPLREVRPVRHSGMVTG